MGRNLVSLIVFFILIVILVGAGILLYRFLVSYNDSKVAVLTINDQGKFTSHQLNLDNDKPFRVKNDDDQKQVVKKQSDNSTVVEVDPKSTSRELSTTDNSRTRLYIASNPDEIATVIAGSAPEENTSNNTDKTPNSGSVEAPNTNSNQPLPNTGPENYLIAPLIALFGYLIYRLSAKLKKV